MVDEYRESEGEPVPVEDEAPEEEEDQPEVRHG